MKSLIYFSQATSAMRPADLKSLLTLARRSNEQHEITGLLLYQSGYFLQCLEGAENHVDRLFKLIHADPRHHEIQITFEQPIEERNFASWHMGFHLLDHEGQPPLSGHVDVLDADIATEIDLANEMTFTMVSLFKQYVRQHSASQS